MYLKEDTFKLSSKKLTQFVSMRWNHSSTLLQCRCQLCFMLTGLLDLHNYQSPMYSEKIGTKSARIQ